MKKLKIILIILIVLVAGIAMATKWSDYGDFGSSTQDTDSLLVLDVSDTTLAATGTQKQWFIDDFKVWLLAWLNALGATPTGAWNFGGATSVEIPNGTDPDVDAVGEITQDTDGANEAADESYRGWDGAAQFLVARKLTCIHGTIVAPNGMADAERDRFPLWTNNTGMVFTITEIKGWSDVDDTTLNVEVVTATNWTTRGTVDALEIATNGTGVFTGVETTITDPTIAHDETITLDFDDTDEPGVVQITICGWFNADID